MRHLRTSTTNTTGQITSRSICWPLVVQRRQYDDTTAVLSPRCTTQEILILSEDIAVGLLMAVEFRGI